MNEIALSNNLKEIELEIDHHKKVAGQSIWEIGRRLNHVKENNLTHGEFVRWVESVGMNRSEAYKFMRIADEISNVGTYQHLGTKALYLIATLPEEEREKEHVTSSGQSKTTDEMTVRELKELKKKLKQKDHEVKLAKRSEEIALKKLEDAENKEPEVIRETVEKEVIPDNYKELESAERRLKAENRRLSDVTDNLKRQLNKLERDSAEIDRMERTIEQLNEKKAEVNRILDANDKLTELEETFHSFFDQNMSPLKYKPLVNDLHGFNGTERIKKLVGLARMWVDDMDQMLPSDNRKMIEGEIVNG